MASLGVAVIGVGSMGRRHAENVSIFPELRLVAIADSRTAVAEAVAGELDCPVWTDDPEEAISHPECQAVVIATRADTHADLVALAARHGRDVLCEKPIALTVADGERAVRAAEAAGVRLQVGFMRRYDPGYARAMELIAAGAIGTPHIFRSISRDREPGPLETLLSPGNGGIFLDSAVHDFDLARWLMGDEVSRVSTLAATFAEGEEAKAGPDTGLVHLCFQRGAIGAVEIYSHAGYGYDIRTEVTGSKGTIRIGRDQDRPLVLLNPEGAHGDFVGHYLDRFATAYERELRDWARRMLGHLPAAVSGRDGVRALQIAVAARQSAAARLPVDVPGDRSLQT